MRFRRLAYRLEATGCSFLEVAEALEITLEQGKQDLEVAWALWKASIDQKGAANPCGN